jgi:tetratricopeptide (TPR) repeat protein
MALRLDAELPLAHRALGSVLLARRRIGVARKHLEEAARLAPQQPDHLRALAGLERVAGKPAEARVLLQRALALDPEDADTFADLGELDLEAGDVASAERRAREALEREPEHLDGLVLMGSIHLRRGEVAEAREHALWALRISPTAASALGLLAAVKARQSWFLGAWWRWNAWMNALGEARAVAVLLGAFLVYRAVTIAIEEGPRAELAQLVNVLWLGACVYTWVSPALFRRMVQRELAQVRLGRGF